VFITLLSPAGFQPPGSKPWLSKFNPGAVGERIYRSGCITRTARRLGSPSCRCPEKSNGAHVPSPNFVVNQTLDVLHIHAISFRQKRNQRVGRQRALSQFFNRAFLQCNQHIVVQLGQLTPGRCALSAGMLFMPRAARGGHHPGDISARRQTIVSPWIKPRFSFCSNIVVVSGAHGGVLQRRVRGWGWWSGVGTR